MLTVSRDGLSPGEKGDDSASDKMSYQRIYQVQNDTQSTQSSIQVAFYMQMEAQWPKITLKDGCR